MQAMNLKNSCFFSLIILLESYFNSKIMLLLFEVLYIIKDQKYHVLHIRSESLRQEKIMLKVVKWIFFHT